MSDMAWQNLRLRPIFRQLGPSPFKGEVRRGMGRLGAEDTHPHPNPPLEGEGV